jgi:hypothetical protein
MYVVALHQITDPAQFWAAAQAGMASIPEGLSLHSVFPNAAGTQAVCLWEAEGVETVRQFVEGSVGHVSTNQFFEVEAKNALGLP